MIVLLLLLSVPLLAMELPDGVYAPAEQLAPQMDGNWIRLDGHEPVPLRPGLAVRELRPGAYVGGDQEILLIRHGADAAAWAEALVGLPAYPGMPLEQLRRSAKNVEAYTPESLPVMVWRLADDWHWPWVEGGDAQQGLARLVRRYNPDQRGFRFDPQQAVYVNLVGKAISIAEVGSPIPPMLKRHEDEAITIAPGDLIAQADPDDVIGRIALLVRDAGLPGQLDPADEIVTASAPRGERIQQVTRCRLGELFGPEPLHLFRRDQQRVAPLRPDNPIWGLPRERQMMVLIGMAGLVIILLRLARKRRRQR
jgi:hypothetical protein